MEKITDEQQKEIFANNLQYYVSLKGKDQKTICAELEINPPTFNQWMKGKAIPRVSEIRLLSYYFNIAITDLINNRKDKKSFSISAEEKQIIESYRMQSNEMKNAVCDILHVKREQMISTEIE